MIQLIDLHIIIHPDLARPNFVKADSADAIAHFEIGIRQLGINDDPENASRN
jgi:hypothetical protein